MFIHLFYHTVYIYQREQWQCHYGITIYIVNAITTVLLILLVLLVHAVAQSVARTQCDTVWPKQWGA